MLSRNSKHLDRTYPYRRFFSKLASPICDKGTEKISFGRVAAISVLGISLYHFKDYSPEWAATLALLLGYVLKSKTSKKPGPPPEEV